MKQFYILIFLLILNHFNVNAQAADYITGLDRPVVLYINNSDLFYAESEGAVFKVDLAEDEPNPIQIGSVIHPTGLTVYGTDLIIGDSGDIASQSDGNIYKLDITSDNSDLIEITSGYDVDYMVLYQNYLLFSDSHYNKVYKVDLSLPNPVRVPVVEGVVRAYFGLAVHGDDLYISSRPTNTNQNFTISKLDLTDDTASPIVVLDTDAGFVYPLGLRTIGDDLYISDINLDKIFKVDLTQNTLSLNELVSNVDGVKDCVPYNNTLYIAEYYGDKISVLDNFNLSVEELYVELEVSIYPNPTIDYLHVSNLPKAVDFKIINSLGQFVKRGSIIPNEKLDVHNLPKGIYMIILNDTFNKKFVKN